MIDAYTYMRSYLSITHCFITPTWSRFLRYLCNLMHYVPQYMRQNRMVYNIILHTTFIKYQINFVMDDDY